MSEPHMTRVLFLTTGYPSAFGSGGQIRSAAIVRLLAAKHEVYLFIVNTVEHLPGPIDPDIQRSCREIKYLKVNSPSTDSMAKGSLREEGVVPAEVIEVSNLAGDQTLTTFCREKRPDLLFVFKMQAIPAVATILHLFPRRYLDLDELPSAREAQIQQLKPGPGHADEEACQAKTLVQFKTLEKYFIPKFDCVFVSSKVEAARVRERVGAKNVMVLPNISKPLPFLPYHPQENPREILSVGTMSMFPNEDAAAYFCREIFPLVRREKGASVSFRICGFGCPESIRALDGRDGVQVSGYVPDLAPLYAQASLVVVPLRAGSGTRLKILEAFRYGRPVVSTSLGSEGLDVTSGRDILLADSPEEFARACLAILDEPQLAQKLVEGGLSLAKSHYLEEALARAYEEAERASAT